MMTLKKYIPDYDEKNHMLIFFVQHMEAKIEKITNTESIFI
jgi:hypothetical protein